MARGGLLEGWSKEGLKAAVSKLLTQLGYSVESSDSYGDGFSFTAVRKEPLGKVKCLIHVHSSGNEVSQRKVSEILNNAKLKDFSKIILFSTSKLSESAEKFSKKHGIEFFDGMALEEMLEKHVISVPRKEKIFELAFDLGKTMSEAAAYFDKERGRKFFGFGVEERIVEVSGRYAPVCSFLISRNEEVKTGFSGTLKNVKKSNLFYVNLHTNELYYISKGLGKFINLASSDVLNRLMSLTVQAVEMLADMVKTGEMPLGQLNDRHELYYEERMSDFRLLWEHGFIVQTPDRKGFMPNLALPAFENQRYNLRDFTSVVKSVSSSFEVDEIKFDAKNVVKLLEVFYAGKGEIKEVIYLPYYTCNYVDDKGMSRVKVLPSPKYLA